MTAVEVGVLISNFKNVLLAKYAAQKRIGYSHEIKVLHQISFSLAAVALLFLIAFGMNSSASYSWFFLSIAVAFILIPILARKGYQNTSKFLLLTYINICILILSTIFGKEMFIQAFFIPAGGLSMLLFDSSRNRLRNLGIGLSMGCYLMLDYVIFEKVYLSAGEDMLIKWSILAAAFITTWMTFNKFAEWREKAEEKSGELFDETQILHSELLQKKVELDEKIQALKDTEEEVKKESESKIEFLSSMSHEIRTPMNAVIGMTNLLVKGNPRHDQFEQLEILDFSAKTLLALINDMLDFSRIESGTIEFENIAFNLNNLFESVLDSFLFTADKNNVRLYVNLAEDIPEMIIGDPSRLTQVLNNLVSNAIQFTESGSVGITAEKVESRGNELKLLIAVKDTGVEISPENQGELFDVFNRKETNNQQSLRGAGLGLTISQKLIEFQDGRIYVESGKGKGCTFFIEMPFGFHCDEHMDTSFGQHITPRTLEGATVLVAEDNIINQKVLSRFLEKWKVRVIVAKNGEQALAKMESNLVNLVLMDLQMPKMDGYEATRLIRSLEDTQKSNIPIIALTAAALKEVKDKVFETGMDDYLTKPFDPDELQEKLKYYILSKDKQG